MYFQAEAFMRIGTEWFKEHWATEVTIVGLSVVQVLFMAGKGGRERKR